MTGLSFCLRAKDPQGQWHRKTYKIQKDDSFRLRWRMARNSSISRLSAYSYVLYDARLWANEEISKITGLTPRPVEELIDKHKPTATHAITFECAAKTVLADLRMDGKTEAYLNRLIDVFNLKMVLFLKTQLSEIDREEVISIIEKASIGNRKDLKTLTRKIFRRYRNDFFQLSRELNGKIPRRVHV